MIGALFGGVLGLLLVPFFFAVYLDVRDAWHRYPDRRQPRAPVPGGPYRSTSAADTIAMLRSRIADLEEELQERATVRDAEPGTLIRRTFFAIGAAAVIAAAFALDWLA